jgi:hypothetical protein
VVIDSSHEVLFTERATSVILVVTRAFKILSSFLDLLKGTPSLSNKSQQARILRLRDKTGHRMTRFESLP